MGSDPKLPESGSLGSDPELLVCPLCKAGSMRPCSTGPWGNYFECPDCGLIYQDPKQHLTIEESRKRYVLHNNHPDDAGYRKFFAPLVDALGKVSPPPGRILDFGTGTGSALPPLLQSLGYEVALYDPLFQPEEKSLGSRYDVVAATEVVEHLDKPGNTFAHMISLLRPGGILALMSLWAIKVETFETWWYQKDPTHISFYGEKSLAWIADKWSLDLESRDDRMAIFKKKPGPLAGK